MGHKQLLLAALCLVGFSFSAYAEKLPGEGKTVRFVRNDSLGANYIQDEILMQGIRQLGYKIELKTLGTAAFLQATAQGDLDMSSDMNMPQVEAAFIQVKDKVELIGEGSIIGGGTNGYLIDKKTSEKYNITGFNQLKDPKIAALFDTDRDGKADLVNCDPGWRCGDVVDFQIKEFGLSDTVRSVRAKYEMLLSETFARFKRGEPVLYYTWQPSWIADTLKPGTDTVWLPIPYDALPENVHAKNGHLVAGLVGCAGGQDPCRMTTGSWNWMTAANREFIKENPAIRLFIEEAKWPGTTWSNWEAELNKNKADRNIKKIAELWIKDNQAQFDGWVAEATKIKN